MKNKKMHEGVCHKTQDNRWLVLSKLPEDDGTATIELPLDYNQWDLVSEGKQIVFEIRTQHVISGGLKPMGSFGGKGLQHFDTDYAYMITIEDMPDFLNKDKNSPHAGISKLGTGPGVKKQIKIPGIPDFSTWKSTNRTKVVKAIFKGTDGSLDYEKNKDYELIIRHINGENIIIERIDGEGLCQYNSLISFLDNWDNIRW